MSDPGLRGRKPLASGRRFRELEEKRGNRIGILGPLHIDVRKVRGLLNDRTPAW